MAGVNLLVVKDYGKTITPWQERHNMLCNVENDIRKDLAKMQECCVYIGYRLLEIEERHLYNTVCHRVRGDYCKNIYQYALQELDLAKTTTFNLMAVAKAFSDDCRGLKEEYRGYSFSQLVELLSFPKEFLPYANPSMSVKELRCLKKGESVRYRDENGFGKSCVVPQEVQQVVKLNMQDSMPVEIAESVCELSQSESHSDVESKLHESSDTSGTVYLHFANLEELRDWYFSDKRKNAPFPLTVSYYVNSNSEEN